MSRLYDRLLRASHKHQSTPLPDREFIDYAREDARDLPQATIIATDNVSQYFYEVSGNDDWRSGGGFPNVAPPMESFFMETRRPKAILDSKGKQAQAATDMPAAWGALFRCEDFKKTFGGEAGWKEKAREAFANSPERLDLGVNITGASPSENPFGMELEEDVRWLMRLSCYMEDPEFRRVFAQTGVRDDIALIAQQFIAVTEEGQIAHFSDGRRARFVMPLLRGQPHSYHMSMNARYLSHPFMAAISFMHCKNVTLDPQQPPQKVSDKHRKNHGRPLCTYHMLQIGPMKEVLEGEGRRKEVGLQHSFHICRGHFRTYTPERGGPFGRTITEPETQYVSAHARGNKNVGEINKDYRIMPSPGRERSITDPAEQAAKQASEGNPSESNPSEKRQDPASKGSGNGGADKTSSGAKPGKRSSLRSVLRSVFKRESGG